MNTTPDFSIVVPIFEEEKNIPLLVKRIAAQKFTQRFEVLLMDDNSKDGTHQVVQELQATYPWLRLIVNRERRDLSKAIISGIRHANFPIVITLDADLSHPPEKIFEMLEILSTSNVEVVIGSRYIKGGSVDSKWPLSRICVSRFCALLARPLVAVKDPLSGFMAMRKEICFRGDPLQPIGWKIGIEIMVKNRCRNIQEIPIHFSERMIGVSKLNLHQGFNYFRHLKNLYWYKFFRGI